MKPLVEMNELTVTRGGFRLGGISLALAPGDYLVLLGPSGCGKTTLLNAVAGVHRVAPGQLRLDGRDVGAWPPQRRHVAYVAQTVDLFPHVDVAGNIAFGLRYADASREEKRRRFDRVADLVGVRALLERAPTTLSGGESKRVALARSLVVEPRVLLLDEPLSMLDYNARAGMFGTLRAIHDELGTTTIHVTHDREEAWALEGRCAVMRAGQLEQVGEVDELFRRPRTRFVAEFLGGSNVFAAEFRDDESGAEAVTAWGRLALAAAPPFARGWVQIRPDSLMPARPGATPAVSGAVRRVADRGIYAEVTVEVAPAVTVTAHLPSAAARDVRAGETIHLACATPPHPIAE